MAPTENSSSFYVNDEVITNILSFLPAKSVAEFQLLDRRVRRLTSDAFFALAQCRHAESADAGFFASFKYGADIRFLDPRGRIPRDACKFLCSTASILSSANGLVFHFDRSHTAPCSIMAYNPALGTSFAVPPPPETMLSHDSGPSVSAIVCKDRQSFAYKLVFVEPTPEWDNRMHCSIYDSRDGDWKVNLIIDGGKRNLLLDEPVVSGSTVFWASDCGSYMRGVDPYIVAFDADIMRSQIVRLPAEAAAVGSSDEYNIRIARWGGRAGPCLIQHRNAASVFALWLMRRGGEAEAPEWEWEKICEVGLKEIFGVSKRTETRVGSFGVINCDLLAFTLGCQLYTYSLKGRQLKNLGSITSAISGIIPYANTLRLPCGRDDAVEKI